MRRVVSHVLARSPKTTWFSCTPSSTVSVAAGDPARARQRARRDDRLELRAAPLELGLLDREPVRVGRGHERACRPRTGPGCRSGPGATRPARPSARRASTVSSSDAVAIVCGAGSTAGSRGKSSAREDVQLRGVAAARDVHDALLRPILDRHLGCREQAREVDEELARARRPRRRPRPRRRASCAARAPCRSRRARAARRRRAAGRRRGSGPSRASRRPRETMASFATSSSRSQVTLSPDPTAMSVS